MKKNKKINILVSSKMIDSYIVYNKIFFYNLIIAYNVYLCQERL